MCRAVELAPSHRNLHRFVWRPDRTTEPQDYRMIRVTFGVSASPFAAVRALQQTAQDFGQDYPKANLHLFISFYVHDCLAGADTPQQALQLQQQLRHLLLKGGFNLRKWRSNSSIIMDAIPETLHDPSHMKSFTADDNFESPKALGIHWNSTNNTLCVSTGTLSSNQPSTKRNIVSDIAQTFDMLGWFEPSMCLVGSHHRQCS